MRLFLLVIFIAACFATLQTKEENGQIKFSLDVHQDTPMGLYLEGIIDPRQETNNKIQAFIKIANKYIPFLESLASSNKEIRYQTQWSYNLGAFKVNFYYNFFLIVGWKVRQGLSNDNFYEVTYIPYVWSGGQEEDSLNGTFFQIYEQTGLLLAFAYAPIGVTLYREGRACFKGNYTAMPVSLRTDLSISLLGCQAEIVDEIINSIPIHLDCDPTPVQNFTYFDYNFTDYYSGDFLPEVCIGF